MNIKSALYKQNKDFIKFSKHTIPLNVFWKIFILSIEFIRRIKMYINIIFIFIILGYFLYMLSILGLMVIDAIRNPENLSGHIGKIIFSAIGFALSVGFLIWYFLKNTFKTTFFEIKTIYQNIQNAIIKGIYHEKDKIFLLYPLSQISKNIIQYNLEIISIFEKYDNFYKKFPILAQKILKIIEKISKYQKFLPIFFKKEYVYWVNNLIFEEIKLLQKILQFSLERQIINHNNIIDDIWNTQENAWENFQEILELQKRRLQNQKELFEKFLQK